jgi:hypothetical protein
MINNNLGSLKADFMCDLEFEGYVMFNAKGPPLFQNII